MHPQTAARNGRWRRACGVFCPKTEQLSLPSLVQWTFKGRRHCCPSRAGQRRVSYADPSIGSPSRVGSGQSPTRTPAPSGAGPTISAKALIPRFFLISSARDGSWALPRLEWCPFCPTENYGRLLPPWERLRLAGLSIHAVYHSLSARPPGWWEANEKLSRGRVRYVGLPWWQFIVAHCFLNLIRSLADLSMRRFGECAWLRWGELRIGIRELAGVGF